jgi:hypothetical protein
MHQTVVLHSPAEDHLGRKHTRREGSLESMPSFAQARRIAESWVAVVTDGDAELVREAVQGKPYGWVFFCQSTAFLSNPDNNAARLAGNAPLIIDRVNGKVRVLGTTLPLKTYLARYEGKLPTARLRMSPDADVHAELAAWRAEQSA